MLAKISWRLLVILVSAGAIAFLTFNYLDSLQETKKIVITSTAIPEKTVITEDMLKTVTVEAKSADTLVADQVNNTDLVVGAITRKKINEGEPVKMDADLIVFPEDRMDYLTKSGKVNLNKFIPNDKRLYTLGLEPNNAIDNRLKKSDYVDVILTGETTGKDTEETFSRMILQYVEVYSVEEFDENQISGLAKDALIQHVTLMVSPQEAVALANAKEEGKLSLALNPSEGKEVDVKMIYQSTLER
jgi:Flp pilus assembly protein CpaB